MRLRKKYWSFEPDRQKLEEKTPEKFQQQRHLAILIYLPQLQQHQHRQNSNRIINKQKGRCQFIRELAVVNVTSWAILPANDEIAIAAAVAHIGPVAVSINATPKTFQLYSDGIYDDDACSSASVNHAMLVIGYDKDSWILKNWWGEMWGEDGYMHIRRGKNVCGIANYAAYAVV